MCHLELSYLDFLEHLYLDLERLLEAEKSPGDGVRYPRLIPGSAISLLCDFG